MQHSESITAPLSMQRAIRILMLLLLVQLALAAALSLRTDPLSASTPQTPLLGAVAESADQLVIESNPSDSTPGGPKSIVLAKRNGHWVLPQYSDAPVRDSQVSSLLSQLAGLKRGLPVGTSSAALKRFKLADADFERRVQLSRGGKTIGTLYIGSSSGVHKAYARSRDEQAAYSVDVASYELPVQQSEWIDGAIASRDLATLSQIDITTDPRRSLQLRHGAGSPPTTASAAPAAAASGSATSAPAGANAWTQFGATPGHEIDGSAVEALARDISALQVQGVLGEQPKPEWQGDHPALTLALKAAPASASSITWSLSKPGSTDYYVLKSSQYRWYFQVDSAQGKQLLDASQTDKLFKGAAGKSATGPVGKPTSGRAASSPHGPRPAAGSRAAGSGKP